MHHMCIYVNRIYQRFICKDNDELSESNHEAHQGAKNRFANHKSNKVKKGFAGSISSASDGYAFYL